MSRLICSTLNHVAAFRGRPTRFKIVKDCVWFFREAKGGSSAFAAAGPLCAPRTLRLLRVKGRIFVVTQEQKPSGNDATGGQISERDGSGQQLAGHYMGFGALLRRWRKAAGVTQYRTARALGMSERTYRKIERGATPPRLSRTQCEALSELLRLDRDERHALLLYNVGSMLVPPSGSSQPELQQALRLLIDRQMPSPAYLCDQHWNILAFNHRHGGVVAVGDGAGRESHSVGSDDAGGPRPVPGLGQARLGVREDPQVRPGHQAE
ncbi:helix-turn-helix domain-containing protein [Streptomyces sp. NPDC094143]|uniref:helix-turn-helix domain-containing protein n=1 Tax=Streptomyces sp. NPDC094143 TaxID=3155310 RepID=UPI00331ECED0